MEKIGCDDVKLRDLYAMNRRLSKPTLVAAISFIDLQSTFLEQRKIQLPKI